MKRKILLPIVLFSGILFTQAQVAVKKLGTAQNLSTAYQLKSTYGALRQVYADPSTKAITYIQQGSPWYIQIKYNTSKDAGATWDTGIVATTASGAFLADAFCQGVILNPTGGTNPNNAYFAYHTFTQTAFNAPGKFGKSFGAQKIDKTTSVTNNRDTASATFTTRDMFVQRKTNTIFVADFANKRGTGPGTGLFDTLVISKYTFNNTTKDIELASRKRMFINSRKKANGTLSLFDAKVAFSPTNTNIGYAVVLADNAVIADSILSPLVFKTIDGGTNWTALPDIDISNIPSIYNECGGSGTILTMMLEISITVDKNDNLHVFSFIAPAGGVWGSFLNTPKYQGYFDLYTTDKGTTWTSDLVRKPMTYYSILGNASTTPYDYHLHDGRPQILTDSTHSKLFYMWTDTDTSTFSLSGGNKYPDIYIRAHDLTTNKWTVTKNFTAGTTVEYNAYFATAASYALNNGSCYKIPVVIYNVSSSVLSGGGISTSPGISNYLDGISICDSEFAVGIDESEGNSFYVSQNFPNPFTNATSFSISLTKTATVSIEYYTITGELVNQTDMGKLQSGNYKIDIDKRNFSPGIYFYTVYVNENKVTRKMIVAE